MAKRFACLLCRFPITQSGYYMSLLGPVTSNILKGDQPREALPQVKRKELPLLNGSDEEASA
ncbi:MAG: hypothetical protein A2156_01095 [Deltaproteobacteria bacterium RBG_16_48_10]|nr:MAG: hypothetical protein A2156_01095 [Deltaproteobacteria bacterium RBG_16_48_10]